MPAEAGLTIGEHNKKFAGCTAHNESIMHSCTRLGAHPPTGSLFFSFLFFCVCVFRPSVKTATIINIVLLVEATIQKRGLKLHNDRRQKYLL